MERIPITIPTDTRAVCVGSGRFLRAVLVPLLQHASGGACVALFQPRGDGFVDACAAAGLQYPVDTIHRDGSITTETIHLAGVGALSRPADRDAFLQLPQSLPALRFVGVGVTDAGFARGSSVMRDLAQFLFACHTHRPDSVLSLINTDNVPRNGELLRTRVLEAQWPEAPPHDSAAWQAFVQYLDAQVHFHNTMVDRLTSHRPTDPLVPLAEPWPSKVLAIQDSARVLDVHVLTSGPVPGVVVRGTREELMLDQKLKLRLANATSSALVYVLALSRYKTNNEARLLPDVLAYRDQLFHRDLLPSLEREGVPRSVALQVYEEWAHRSSHPHFGLVNLWVTQNAWLHFSARLFPSLEANVTRDDGYRASPFMVFATASILRFLTPLAGTSTTSDGRAVFVGTMDDVSSATPSYEDVSGDWVYGGGLHANLTTGQYEFVDAPQVEMASRLSDAATKWRDELTHKGTCSDSASVLSLVTTILSHVSGFDVERPAYAQFAVDVTRMYTRLVCGRLSGKASALDILQDVVATSVN